MNPQWHWGGRLAQDYRLPRRASPNQEQNASDAQADEEIGEKGLYSTPHKQDYNAAKGKT
jgi:hypothetical protein